MSKPKGTRISGKVGVPGVGEISVSQEFSSEEFSIIDPGFKETDKRVLCVQGIGAKQGWRVLLMNLLRSGCYLQSDVGEPTAIGEWTAWTTFSEHSGGSDRLIYAFLVKAEDLDRVRKLLAQSNKIKKITQAEQKLTENKIPYKISKGIKVIYNPSKR